MDFSTTPFRHLMILFDLTVSATEIPRALSFRIRLMHLPEWNCGTKRLTEKLVHFIIVGVIYSERIELPIWTPTKGTGIWSCIEFYLSWRNSMDVCWSYGIPVQSYSCHFEISKELVDFYRLGWNRWKDTLHTSKILCMWYSTHYLLTGYVSYVYTFSFWVNIAMFTYQI